MHSEIYSILKGEVTVPIFNDYGKIIECVILNNYGPTMSVELPLESWHSLVVRSPEAVVHEIILGKYDPKTHKDFAPWAPKEDSKEAQRYLVNLKRRVNDFLST